MVPQRGSSGWQSEEKALKMAEGRERLREAEKGLDPWLQLANELLKTMTEQIEDLTHALGENTH